MKAMSRRLTRVSARLDPAPDPAFLAYARAVVAWGGNGPDEAAVVQLARDLASGDRVTGCPAHR